jgi:hypothetical protein
MPQEAAEPAPRSQHSAPAPVSPHPPAPVGRVVVGAVFALGLYLGLRKLATGVVLASAPDPDSWWSSFEGLVTVCGGQMLAVVFGAVAAAAGRTGGFAFGASVGGLCGAMFLGAELAAGAPARDLVLYIQPGLLVLVGGIAGVFAARIWCAVPALDMPIPDRSKLSSSRFALETAEELERPTAWVRILAGAMIMVAALAVAEEVRFGAQKYSGGALRVETIGQGRFLTWQLAVLGMMVGGVVAGSTTGAGIRHGFVAGVLCGVGVLGLTAANGSTLSPLEFWLTALSLNGLPPQEPIVVVVSLVGVILLSVFGGWLGGSLFPPLAPEHMRGRLRTGLD